MSGSIKGPVRTIASAEELLAYSLALETEAVERFNDLASAGKQLPSLLAWEFEWDGGESPEGGAMEDAHYLMQPWHAIELAMQGEKRAVAFFRHVADTATDDKVLKMALELVEEEEEHVALLKEWQERFPRPDEGWDEDLDPPTMLE